MNIRDIDILLGAVPENGCGIDWAAIESTVLKPYLDAMADTAQDPEYHGEGDVYTHTKAVCTELIALDEYRSASDKDKEILFLSALLHDIGKPSCTVFRDGTVSSPNHAKTGAKIARRVLWRDLGLCGEKKAAELREAVCLLIKYHSFPPYAQEDKDAEQKLLKIASNAELTQGFSVNKLCILEKADILGRKSKDTGEKLDRVEYCRMLAQDVGCLDGAYAFASDHSKRAYFCGRTAWKDQDLYDDTYGEVILMSGLPGTGKDTWIKKNLPHLPMISLDDIRVEMGISPTDEQGAVIARGHELARMYLRKKESFVWNATNITSQLRGTQISLFEQYGARVKTVFLETDTEEQLRRNTSRKAEVPEAVIDKMLSKLEIPERFESTSVIWEMT